MEKPGAHGEHEKNQQERLENENRRLSEQVKSLLRAEYELSKIQGQLDTQIRLYRQLYQVSNEFNATFDLDEILQLTVKFVLYNLNFERCLLLLSSEEARGFRVEALDINNSFDFIGLGDVIPVRFVRAGFFSGQLGTEAEIRVIGKAFDESEGYLTLTVVESVI